MSGERGQQRKIVNCILQSLNDICSDSKISLFIITHWLSHPGQEVTGHRKVKTTLTP